MKSKKIGFKKDDMIKVKSSNNELIRISPSGELVKLDNELCRETSITKEGEPVHDYQVMAKLIVELLDAAAKEVDHILKEGGGTWGDTIRNLSIG